MSNRSSIDGIIERSRAYNCVQCAKCSSVCPLSGVDESFSPRLIAEKILLGFDEILYEKGLWTCLTCGACDDKCPSDVDYRGFIRELRGKSRQREEVWKCAHGGVLQSLMRMMSDSALKQDRVGWITGDMKVADKGEILFFVGCLPYFDIIFEDFGVKSTDIAGSAVKIFNHLGVTPVVMQDERCCGHDLLWSGDTENFMRLAKNNLKQIKKTGAVKVVTSCPECYRTLKLDYAEYFGEQDFEVLHFSEYLSDSINRGELVFNEACRLNGRVTYQDPCRLGRHLGVYEQPRDVLGSIPGACLGELELNRDRAVCCGSSCWINCGQSSKEIQKRKLEEAKSIADLLVTACPKCQIHLKCAMGDLEGMDMDVVDLTVLAARALGYLV